MVGLLVKKGVRWLLNGARQLHLRARLSLIPENNYKTSRYHSFIDGRINQMANGAHEAKSPLGSNGVAVHVIPVSLTTTIFQSGKGAISAL